MPGNEIFWGGVGRDGIPAIDAPKFVTPEDATFLRDWDRVLGVIVYWLAWYAFHPDTLVFEAEGD